VRLLPQAWRRRPPEAEPAAPAPLEPAPTVGRIHAGWERNLGARSPSLAADAGRLAGLDVAAASAAGALHLHEGIERQDAYAIGAVGGVLVAAVADGVSSRPRSGEGARAACALTADALTALGERELQALLDDGDPGRLVGALPDVERGVRALAGDEPEALATTLVVAVARPEREGTAAVVIGVGDSSALVLGESGPTTLLGEKSTSSSELRDFLPRDGALARATGTALWLAPAAALVLVTDGVAEDLALSGDVRRWLTARWREPLTPLDAAHALTYRRQGSFDDRTAVVIRPGTEDRRSR
jgi:serine/threonine protein phosphatase PrpC